MCNVVRVPAVSAVIPVACLQCCGLQVGMPAWVYLQPYFHSQFHNQPLYKQCLSDVGLQQHQSWCLQATLGHDHTA